MYIPPTVLFVLAALLLFIGACDGTQPSGWGCWTNKGEWTTEPYKCGSPGGD